MSNPVEEFHKSSLCDTGTCVEVSIGDQVRVRNSTQPDQMVAFTKDEWRAFVAGIRLGEFEVH